MDDSGPGRAAGEQARRRAASRTEREGAGIKRELAQAITGAFERAGLTVRGAQQATGIAAADFSRIRNGDLGRFSIDRLMTVAGRLGLKVELEIREGAPRRAGPPARGGPQGPGGPRARGTARDGPTAASRGTRASGRRRSARH